VHYISNDKLKTDVRRSPTQVGTQRTNVEAGVSPASVAVYCHPQRCRGGRVARRIWICFGCAAIAADTAASTSLSWHTWQPMTSAA